MNHSPPSGHCSCLNILIVDDHLPQRERMIAVLQAEGHHVTGLSCVDEVDELPGSMGTDLLVIDLNLPDESGIKLASRFRAAQAQVGIVMVSADHALEHKVRAYQSGADIFLESPLDGEELVAVVAALSRRLKARTASQANASPEVFRLESRSMLIAGPKGKVSLTDAEAAILMAMARAPGQRLESWQILDLLGIAPDAHSKSNLEVRIVRLRKKLMGLGAGKTCIRVVRSLGYQLCITLQVQ